MAKKKGPPVRIAVVNDKGGVGKTTICMMICMYLSVRGKRVLLHDSDVSGSAVAWSKNAAAAGAPLPFDVADNNTVGIRMQEAAYDYIVVDTPTDANAKANIDSLAAVTDYMVIPLRPGTLELDRMNVTMAAIRTAPRKETLQIGFVINGNQRTRVAEGTAAYLAEQNYPVIAKVPHRKDYQERFGEMIPDALLEPVADILKNFGIRVRA